MEESLKYVDNLSKNMDSEKQEGSLKEWLNSIESNESFKKFSNIWDSFSEKEKEDIYNGGDYLFSIKWSMKRNFKLINPITSPFRSPLVRFFEKKSFKEQFTKDSFEVVNSAIRFMVHLWILKKPENISTEVLLKNLKKDAKNIRTKMWILEKAAMIIPQLRPALPVIQKLKPIIERSSNLAEKTMIDKQKELSLSNTIEDTNWNLRDLLAA